MGSNNNKRTRRLNATEEGYTAVTRGRFVYVEKREKLKRYQMSRGEAGRKKNFDLSPPWSLLKTQFRQAKENVSLAR